VILWLFACAEPTAPPPAPPDPCAIYRAPSPGPLAKERAAAAADPKKVATLSIREARLTGDPGFYTLAETALQCAQTRTPGDKEIARLLAHLGIQFHRFAEVEATATKLTAADANWLDWALLGDAQMEQGKLDAAGVSYQHAADLRPGIEMYDRIAWLRWLWGDVDGSVEMQKLAVESGTATDPEPWAWVLTRLGWLHALRGEPAPELDAALALLPDYRPARFARGRVRLFRGEPGAAEDLRAAGRTIEAVWALSELDPNESVETVRTQDPRGYAMWLTPRDAKGALALLQDEWKVRQDATTRMARAYAAWRASDTSIDVSAEARAALATGSVEPRVLLYGGRILGDDALIARAIAMGPGLLPSERR
jgi:hypothetical protein